MHGVGKAVWMGEIGRLCVGGLRGERRQKGEGEGEGEGENAARSRRNWGVLRRWGGGWGGLIWRGWVEVGGWVWWWWWERKMVETWEVDVYHTWVFVGWFD